jgi:hypothetical protein
LSAGNIGRDLQRARRGRSSKNNGHIPVVSTRDEGSRNEVPANSKSL